MRPCSGLLATLLAVSFAAPCVAAPAVFTGSLSGASESPPNASPGSGNATVGYDPDTGMMTLEIAFSGLTGTVTMAHIHCCTPGPGMNAGIATLTPTFPGFPAGVTAGTYQNSFDMMDPASYNAPFLANHGGSPAAALAALLDAMGSGRAYFNIHTTMFPGGEIRADLFDDRIFGDGFE